MSEGNAGVCGTAICVGHYYVVGAGSESANASGRGGPGIVPQVAVRSGSSRCRHTDRTVGRSGDGRIGTRSRSREWCGLIEIDRCRCGATVGIRSNYHVVSRCETGERCRSGYAVEGIAYRAVGIGDSGRYRTVCVVVAGNIGSGQTDAQCVCRTGHVGHFRSGATVGIRDFYEVSTCSQTTYTATGSDDLIVLIGPFVGVRHGTTRGCYAYFSVGIFRTVYGIIGSSYRKGSYWSGHFRRSTHRTVIGVGNDDVVSSDSESVHTCRGRCAGIIPQVRVRSSSTRCGHAYGSVGVSEAVDAVIGSREYKRSRFTDRDGLYSCTPIHIGCGYHVFTGGQSRCRSSGLCRSGIPGKADRSGAARSVRCSGRTVVAAVAVHIRSGYFECDGIGFANRYRSIDRAAVIVGDLYVVVPGSQTRGRSHGAYRVAVKVGPDVGVWSRTTRRCCDSGTVGAFVTACVGCRCIGYDRIGLSDGSVAILCTALCVGDNKGVCSSAGRQAGSREISRAVAPENAVRCNATGRNNCRGSVGYAVAAGIGTGDGYCDGTSIGTDRRRFGDRTSVGIGHSQIVVTCCEVLLIFIGRTVAPQVAVGCGTATCGGAYRTVVHRTAAVARCERQCECCRFINHYLSDGRTQIRIGDGHIVDTRRESAEVGCSRAAGIVPFVGIGSSSSGSSYASRAVICILTGFVRTARRSDQCVGLSDLEAFDYLAAVVIGDGYCVSSRCHCAEVFSSGSVAPLKVVGNNSSTTHDGDVDRAGRIAVTIYAGYCTCRDLKSRRFGDRCVTGCGTTVCVGHDQVVGTRAQSTYAAFRSNDLIVGVGPFVAVGSCATRYADADASVGVAVTVECVAGGGRAQSSGCAVDGYGYGCFAGSSRVGYRYDVVAICQTRKFIV